MRDGVCRALRPVSAVWGWEVSHSMTADEWDVYWGARERRRGCAYCNARPVLRTCDRCGHSEASHHVRCGASIRDAIGGFERCPCTRFAHNEGH